MRHASGFSCHIAADAVGFSAKESDGFLLLVLNFDVIHAGQFALMLNPRGGGQLVSDKARSKEIDCAARGHRRQPWLLQA